MMLQVFNLFGRLSMAVLVLVVENQTEKMVSKCLFLWVYYGILLKFLRDDIQKKKIRLNGHCPLSSDPPPPSPKRAR